MTNTAKKMIGRKAERPGTKDCQFDSARLKTFLLTSFLLSTMGHNQAGGVKPAGRKKE